MFSPICFSDFVHKKKTDLILVQGRFFFLSLPLKWDLLRVLILIPQAMNIHSVKAFRVGPIIVNACMILFSTYFVYFLLIETTFAAEEIIILSHTESTLTTDSAKVFCQKNEIGSFTIIYFQIIQQLSLNRISNAIDR